MIKGDFVRLNSGGPKMKIEEVWDKHFVCSWVVVPWADEKGKTFRTAALFAGGTIHPVSREKADMDD